MPVWVFPKIRRKPPASGQRAIFRSNLFLSPVVCGGFSLFAPWFWVAPVRPRSIPQPMFASPSAPSALPPSTGASPACAAMLKALAAACRHVCAQGPFPWVRDQPLLGSLQTSAPHCTPATPHQAQHGLLQPWYLGSTSVPVTPGPRAPLPQPGDSSSITSAACIPKSPLPPHARSEAESLHCPTAVFWVYKGLAQAACRWPDSILPTALPGASGAEVSAMRPHRDSASAVQPMGAPPRSDGKRARARNRRGRRTP